MYQRRTASYPHGQVRASTTGHIEGSDTNTGRDAFSQVREFEGQAQRIVNEYSVTKEQEQEDSAVIQLVNAAQKSMMELLLTRKPCLATKTRY